MRRRVYLLVLVVLSMSLLTGCLGLVNKVKEEMDTQTFSGEQENEDEELQASTEYEDDTIESATESVVADEGRFQFTVPLDYEQMESDLVFMSSDGMSAVGINGVSALGSGEPEELFEQFVEFYEEQSKELLERSDEVSEFTSVDGSDCFVGDLIVEMTDSTFNHTKVVMVPNKNLMISVTHQSVNEEDLEPQILEDLIMSFEFTLCSQDEISGYTFVRPDNGSEFVFNDDGSVQYYKNENVHEDNYFDGTYEVLRGQEAIDELIAMTEYGYTQEELDMVMQQSMDNYSLMVDREETTYSEGENGELVAETTGSYFVCEDSFYVVKITWKESKVDGVEEKMEDILVPFLGHYILELGSFDCLNLNTVSTQLWERQ